MKICLKLNFHNQNPLNFHNQMEWDLFLGRTDESEDENDEDMLWDEPVFVNQPLETQLVGTVMKGANNQQHILIVSISDKHESNRICFYLLRH